MAPNSDAVKAAAAEPASSAEGQNAAARLLQWNSGNDRRAPGIRWARAEGEIDRLNALVAVKTKKFVEDAAKTGAPLAPEVQAVVNSNEAVYKKRWIWLPVFYALCSLCFVMSNFESPCTILITFLFSFMWYDLFSGVLHVNLDNPEFINFPILHEPCLEFQWHHHIPLDLTAKSFLEVCGDLNMVVGILFFIYATPMALDYTAAKGFGVLTPTYLCLVGWKLLMAYFGQLCHCMSHMPLPHKPKWVVTLQDAGLMISTKEHNGHHKTYDDNFCIGSGLCNPIIAGLRKVTTNKWLWLALFIFTLIADVPLANLALATYVGLK